MLIAGVETLEKKTEKAKEVLEQEAGPIQQKAKQLLNEVNTNSDAKNVNEDKQGLTTSTMNLFKRKKSFYIVAAFIVVLVIGFAMNKKNETRVGNDSDNATEVPPGCFMKNGRIYVDVPGSRSDADPEYMWVKGPRGEWERRRRPPYNFPGKIIENNQNSGPATTIVPVDVGGYSPSNSNSSNSSDTKSKQKNTPCGRCGGKGRIVVERTMTGGYTLDQHNYKHCDECGKNYDSFSLSHYHDLCPRCH